MVTMLILPWRWAKEPRPQNALVFASMFDGPGLRRGWRVFTAGVRLRRAVLGAPGALGVSLRAHPLQGRYYTLSMWRDQQSLLAFAHGPAHRRAIRSVAELGPARQVLVSRDASTQQRPTWRDTMRWLAAAGPGPYRHQPATGTPQDEIPASRDVARPPMTR
jgi:hypothetical protein